MDRKLSVDLLKIAMALFVVGVHANPFSALGPDANILLGGGLFRVAVPVFFIINGYFLDPVLRSGGAKTYILRVLGLYGLWTALYLPAWGGLLDNPDPRALIRFMLMGWWQLWYLPGLALAVALAAAVQNWPLRWQLLAMALTFLAGVGLVYAMAADVFHPPREWFGDATVLHRNGLFTGFPFVMAGILIRRYHVADQIRLPVLGSVAAVALVLVLAESVAIYVLAPKGVNHDNLIMLALASPTLFLLALKFPRQSRGKTLGVYANGLFFIHVAFCVIGFRFTDLSRFWIFSMAVAGSLAITWLLIRTGLARRLL